MQSSRLLSLREGLATHGSLREQAGEPRLREAGRKIMDGSREAYNSMKESAKCRHTLRGWVV